MNHYTSGTSLEAASNQIHFWRYRLEADGRAVQESNRVLSNDEQARAERISRLEAHDRFILARGGLRHILSQYLDADPRDLAFAYAERGKPYLEGSDISFNLSHSGEMAVYAVTRSRTVGVDVEFVGRRVSRDAVAQRFFAPEETAVIDAAPDGEKERTFFTIWTLKEAYLKARGGGISIPLDSFAVTPGEPIASLLREDGDPEAGRKWKLISVDVGNDYVAAICAEGQGWKMEQISWPER